MAELMRLYNTYLGPASDTLIDLGATDARWNNSYFSGTLSSTIVSAQRVNAETTTTVRLVTNNGSFSTLNTVVLQQTAQNVQNGDVWFKSSSNQMYLFARSNGINFYIAMGTTNAYPAL